MSWLPKAVNWDLYPADENSIISKYFHQRSSELNLNYHLENSKSIKTRFPIGAPSRIAYGRLGIYYENF